MKSAYLNALLWISGVALVAAFTLAAVASNMRVDTWMGGIDTDVLEQRTAFVALSNILLTVGSIGFLIALGLAGVLKALSELPVPVQNSQRLMQQPPRQQPISTPPHQRSVPQPPQQGQPYRPGGVRPQQGPRA
ncbi:hypothetical protein [Humidisolicoccus flavus]|uniref:hypothetical protein n=1 Tax=Humidisolicoccus flavus TaxID=3111414 RepID=UPI0032431F13